MPSHRVTFSFGPVNTDATLRPSSALGSLYGWTESFYRSADETDAIAIAQAQALYGWRRLMLTQGWRCTGIRVSRYPLTRTAAKKTLSQPDGVGSYPFVGGTSGQDEQPYDALVVSVAGITGRVRAFSMRGIANEVVSPNGKYLAPGVFDTMLTNWGIQLTTNVWCLRRSTTGTVNPIQNIAVAGAVGPYTATQVTPVVVLVGLPADVVIGATVRITGALGMRNINGIWTVRSTNAVAGQTQVLLAQKRTTSVVGLYTAGGVMVPLTYTLETIASVAGAQGGSRRTGSFSGRPRGRRSPKRS